MKKVLTILLASILSPMLLFGNGVGIINAELPEYLKLVSSEVVVNVDNQVALVTSTQTFMNESEDSTKFKYAFPLPEGASATSLSWFKNGKWETANISAEPQDTSASEGSGNQVHPSIEGFLGKAPLFFSIRDYLQKDSLITIELQYVQLLDYEFGSVSFYYPNNYNSIQPSPIEYHKFEFNLTSGRTIESIELRHQNPTHIENDGVNSKIICESSNSQLNRDYFIEYSLSKSEFGLFGFSTLLSDSIIFDKGHGAGYFTFVVEPNPQDNTEIIDKVFTLVIDKSGSMSGTKMFQAREAASFIVNNLNEDDMFNIISFESDVNSFRSRHVINSQANRNDALNYISQLNSGGGTNISGALGRAISQYASADETTANIIIFFTDGQASSGITDTDGILRHVEEELQNHDTEIMLFSFGIGQGANQRLLTLLATQNNGLAQFLDNNQLEESITNFYLNIQSPVLLGTEIDFSNSGISEVYPNPLPSLYQGQQMIVSGRYKDPIDTEITLSGQAFGKDVEYKYNLSLSDSTVVKNQFLTKIWAKRKIENLLVRYHALDHGTTESDILEEQILTLSIAYGIITEFTSFTDDTHLTDIEEIESTENKNIVNGFLLLGNYPNPFNPSTKIKFSVGEYYSDLTTVRIYNSIGQLVREITINVNGKGVYEVAWDGLNEHGELVPSGMYIYTIDFGNTILSAKMILMK